MEYVRLGSTGLKVSRICLGTMTYGTPEWRPWVLDEAAEPPVLQTRARIRHQLLRHRRHVFARCQRRSDRARAEGIHDARSGGHRDQGVLSDGRRSERPRPVAQAHFRRDRCLAPPAGHRLCRPVPDSSLRFSDADRRNARSAPRRRQGGEGALYRRVEHERLAVREDAARCRRAWLDAFRHHAESLQPRVPRRRARDDAALPRGGHRRDSVEPARARISRRQPQPRRSRRDDSREDRRVLAPALLRRLRLHDC